MTRPSRAFLLAFAAVVTHVAASTLGYSQTYYQDQQARVNSLPTVVARSDDPSDLLLASLETIFHNPEICCGRSSALEDSAQAADARSLKDIASKLDGRHLLGDGRPIHVTAAYLTPEAVTASHVVGELADQHPMLMQWNSHLYVVYGVVYVRTEDPSEPGTVGMITRKFLLWDTRYSDERRNVVFDRESEDPNKVQGLLFLQWHMD